MGITTEIEFADSTLNLEMGCDGCELWNAKVRTCYAGVMTRKYEGNTGWPVKFEEPQLFPDRAKLIRTWPDLTGTNRALKPWLNGMPRVIFLNDLGDTFTRKLPVDWLMPFVPTMEFSPHIYLFLTKRTDRMAQFFKLLGRVPNNFWPGTTVTGPHTLNRLRVLREIGDTRTIRWVSLEPLLGDLEPGPGGRADFAGIGWMVTGMESGPRARPGKAEWVVKLHDEAERIGAAFFLKQWGVDANNPTYHDPTSKTYGGMSKGGAQLFGREHRQMPKWLQM